MLSKPKLAGREAVTRFFPSCAGYDHRTADRFIDWLESCGYAIVPRNEVVLVPDEAGSDPRQVCIRAGR